MQDQSAHPRTLQIHDQKGNYAVDTEQSQRMRFLPDSGKVLQKQHFKKTEKAIEKNPPDIKPNGIKS